MSSAVWYCPICFKEGYESDVQHCPKDGCAVVLTADREAEWIGQTIADKYKVLEFIGAGGMADVFEVERLPSGKRLALKLLKPAFTGDATLMERFRQEAILISLIAHRNIVNLEDFGVTDGGITYMAMELLKGYTLGDALSMGTMDPDTAFELVMQACEGMAAAHERGVIHRDLKPENLFIQKGAEGEKPVVKILDLGIGKLFNKPASKGLTMAGTVVGTPAYMSPEQCKGEESGIPTDIYSMGIVLYEMLFGQVPFDDESPILVLPKHINEYPEWDETAAKMLGIPAEAEPVLMRALAKDPAQRQDTMVELQGDIATLRSRVQHGRRYSLPSPDVLKESRRKGTPMPSIAPPPGIGSDEAMKRRISTQPTMAVKASRPPAVTIPEPVKAKKPAGHAIPIADGIYWVGRHHGRQLECNIYLRVFESNGEKATVLVDPGPPRDFDAVLRNVESVIGSVENLDFIFINHQDPDVAGNTAELQRMNPRLRVVCTEDTWRLAQHYGLDPKRYIPTHAMEDGRLQLATGHGMRFVPTPFCHDRGAMMLYDEEQKVLFSGDLFGGTTAMEGLMYGTGSLEGIEFFHKTYMPCRKALSQALDRVKKLDPLPTLIAPQHGNVIPRDQVPAIIDAVGRLKVGIDSLPADGAPSIPPEEAPSVLDPDLDAALKAFLV